MQPLAERPRKEPEPEDGVDPVVGPKWPRRNVNSGIIVFCLAFFLGLAWLIKAFLSALGS